MSTITKRTGLILVGIVAMVSVGLLVGSRISDSEAGGNATVAYAVLTKQAPFKGAGMVIFQKSATAGKVNVDFNAVMIPNPGKHPAHIHAKLAGAQCTAGTVVTDLSASAVVNAGGVVTTKKVVSGDVNDMIGRVVVIHDTDFKYVACGIVKKG